MVLHQNKTVQSNAKTQDHFGNHLQEMLPVTVIPENRFPFGLRDAQSLVAHADGDVFVFEAPFHPNRRMIG